MIIILDTETAGFSGPIMQLAYACYDSESMSLIQEYNLLLKHGEPYEVHPDALKIHGLTYDLCQEWGALAQTSLRDLAEKIDKAVLFVAHNVSFDWRMLQNEWARYGLFQDSPEVKTKTLCTKNHPNIRSFVNAKDKNGNPKAPSLAELHRHLFNEEIQGAHDALADVRATAKCFFELLRLNVIELQK